MLLNHQSSDAEYQSSDAELSSLHQSSVTNLRKSGKLIREVQTMRLVELEEAAPGMRRCTNPFGSMQGDELRREKCDFRGKKVIREGD
jgi:hypothetical protein